MFGKRFLLIMLLGGLLEISLQAGSIPVSLSYQNVVVPGQTESQSLVTDVRIGSKSDLVSFAVQDSLFRSWKITGSNFEGTCNLFVSKDRGIGWNIKSGGDSLKVMIARDVRNAYDPRLISMTTDFVSGLFILENLAPECNSSFRVYTLKNSWDADVEYTGPVALQLVATDPCGSGTWRAKTGKLAIPQKVQYVAIFVAAMSQNIRLLFKDYKV